jgi:hypothetical protein
VGDGFNYKHDNQKVTSHPLYERTRIRALSADRKKIDDAATRTLDFYLKPKPKLKNERSDNANTTLRIDPGADSECLLSSLMESLASANGMTRALALDLDGPRRHVALGVSGCLSWVSFWRIGLWIMGS